MAMNTTMSFPTMAMATQLLKRVDHSEHLMDGGCKVSMLWNWETIDTCFISSSWHNTSNAWFGFTCGGVFFLAMLLQLFYRCSRDWDRRTLSKAYAANQNTPEESTGATHGSGASGEIAANAADGIELARRRPAQTGNAAQIAETSGNGAATEMTAAAPEMTGAGPGITGTNTESQAPQESPRTQLMKPFKNFSIFWPKLRPQLVRTALYTLTFTGMYFIHWFAMFGNGFIFFCVIIGTFLGSLVGGWDHLQGKGKCPWICEKCKCSPPPSGPSSRNVSAPVPAVEPPSPGGLV